MKDENILTVQKLKVKFDEHIILKDINFEVKRDSTLAIIGPNGAGKTVLFKAILNLISYEGTVSWGKDCRIGYVPQKILVGKDLPLTVKEFLALKEKNHSLVVKALESVGLGEGSSEEVHRGVRLLKTRIGALSGGELQRVLIAFALLANPNILLFDEPTSGIDISGEETVYALISKLKKDKDLTIIFISHELDIVYKYADNVLCLNKENICFGPPQKAIDKESLQALYGEDIHFYKHQESSNSKHHYNHHHQ